MTLMERLPDRLAETLLQSVEENAPSLRDEKLWSIHATLVKAAVCLRSAHNARQGLLRLPPEVLSNILEAIPDLYSSRWTDFQPFWRSGATDSSMLIPVSHTCRRLREIALAHHSLWGTLTTKKPQLVHSFAERSRPAPLTIAAWSQQNNIPPVFAITFAGEAERIQELHLSSIELQHMTYLYELLKSPLPGLKSFTLNCYLVTSRWDDKLFVLPLSRERNPLLRFLALTDVPFLPETGFPMLTHMSLTYVSVPNLYSRVVDLIAGCPRIESVALGGLWADTDIPDIHASKTPLPLSHLRHITLHELRNKTLQLFMSLLQPRTSDSSYHILGHDSDDQASLADFLFPSKTHKGPEELPAEDLNPQLCISIHPDRNGDFSTWDRALAITITTHDQTRRLAAYSGQRRSTWNNPIAWISSVLSTRTATLTDIREVWIANAAPSTVWPRPPSPTSCNIVDSPLVHLPALATVVLVSDHTFLLGAAAQPRLYLLPSSQDPAFVAPNLSTLHIVHGYSDYALAQRRATEKDVELADTLDFTGMLEALGTGAYDYLRGTRLVVQTAQNVWVDKEDLDKLRVYFEAVRHESLEALPAMPVRGEDPMRRGCEKWPGALW